MLQLRQADGKAQKIIPAQRVLHMVFCAARAASEVQAAPATGKCGAGSRRETGGIVMRVGEILLVAVVLLATQIAWAEVSAKAAVRVILGEAADQDFRTKLAVAEVIRRRKTLSVFSAARRPHLQQFADAQPKRVQKEARRAWESSAYTNIADGATHFENVAAFGEPWWSREMIAVAHFGKLTFYRKAQKS